MPESALLNVARCQLVTISDELASVNGIKHKRLSRTEKKSNQSLGYFHRTQYSNRAQAVDIHDFAHDYIFGRSIEYMSFLRTM